MAKTLTLKLSGNRVARSAPRKRPARLSVTVVLPQGFAAPLCKTKVLSPACACFSFLFCSPALTAGAISNVGVEKPLVPATGAGAVGMGSKFAMCTSRMYFSFCKIVYKFGGCGGCHVREAGTRASGWHISLLEVKSIPFEFCVRLWGCI